MQRRAPFIPRDMLARAQSFARLDPTPVELLLGALAVSWGVCRLLAVAFPFPELRATLRDAGLDPMIFIRVMGVVITALGCMTLLGVLGAGVCWRRIAMLLSASFWTMLAVLYLPSLHTNPAPIVFNAVFAGAAVLTYFRVGRGDNVW